MIWWEVVLLVTASGALVANGMVEEHDINIDFIQEHKYLSTYQSRMPIQDDLDSVLQPEENFLETSMTTEQDDLDTKIIQEQVVLTAGVVPSNDTGLSRISEKKIAIDQLNARAKKGYGRTCSPTSSCTHAGGHCFHSGGKCNGTVDSYGCLGGKKCICCIPDKVATVTLTCPDTSCPTYPAVCPEDNCTPCPTRPATTHLPDLIGGDYETTPTKDEDVDKTAQFDRDAIFCCDTNSDVYNTSVCLEAICNEPMEGNSFGICREGKKSIDEFFTTEECQACYCFEDWRGRPNPACYISKCPGSPLYKPHYKCQTLTKDQGELGCCIDYFCDNTICKSDWGAYLDIGDELVDPDDPCRTCQCLQGDSKNSPPTTIYLLMACLIHHNPECRPIKRSQDCCPTEWDCTNTHCKSDWGAYLGIGDEHVDPDDPCRTCQCWQGDSKNSPPTISCLVTACLIHPNPECRPIKHSQDCCPTEWDCTNSYLLVTPKRWAAGEEADVCIFTPSGDNVNLKVELYNKTYNTGRTLIISDKDMYCTNISIAQEVQSGPFSLSVSGNIGNLSIHETRNIQVVNIAKTWVQTDKFLYLMGQLVQFRILTVLGLHFQVSYDKILEVHITSPSGSRIAQWLNINNTQGIVHLDFLLPEEPEEGEYQIQVKTSISFASQRFKVEPYVLPRFTVTITPPTYILATDMEANFTICANYTFGKPLQGHFTYNARPSYFYHQPEDGENNKLLLFDGCREVTITPNDIYGMATLFTLEATVEEKGTGVSAQGKVNVQIHRKQLVFTKITKDNYYKPGLPCTLQILVSNPDNSPAIYHELDICVLKSICSKLSTDADGILTAIIPSNRSWTETQIPVTIKCEDCFNSSTVYGFYYPEESSVTYYFQRFFSPSGSFMSLKSTILGADCELGRDVAITIEYVAKEVSEAQLWIVLISAGRIMSTSPYQVEFESTPVLMDHSQVIGGEPEHFNSSHVRGVTNVTKLLPNGISNLVKILVWYARADGEVVAASTSLKVPECQNNPTALSWTPGHPQEPGQSVNVTLMAKPESICSLGVVDKSVYLLSQIQGEGHLTFATLTSLLQELEPPLWETQSNDQHYCRGGFRKKRDDENELKKAQLKSFIPIWGSYTEEKDAITVFDDSGVYVFSDLTIETRPCINFQYGVFDTYESNNNLMLANELQGAIIEPEDQQREYFPETWLWKILMVPDSGLWQEELELPDTITEWVGISLCVHPEAGLGISNMASVVTFTSFFLDLTIPPTIKQGEAVPLKISVFNYLSEEIPVSVELTGTGKYSVLSGTGNYSVLSSDRVRSYLCIGPKTKEVTTLVLRPLVAGSVNLTVSAYIDPEMQESCGVNITSGRRDTVVREIKVKWEGVEKQVTRSGYLCGGDDAQWQFTVPNNTVNGSARGFINVAADLMGPTINNLDHLVRMPYGCGEQNMLGFTPNIFVMKYLSASGLVTQDIVQRAEKNMEAGYKRELQYRHGNGSYSAFGSRDDSGSTWLTAFVLKSFAQARLFITVNEVDLILSQVWLESLQRSDGCFNLVGKVIHKDMKGGLSGSDSDQLAPLTSYVIISLLEADLNSSNDTIEMAISCINNATMRTFYTEALRAYALALSGDDSAEKVLINALELVQIEEDSTSGSISVLIEAMAYVLLAMLTYQPDEYVAEIAGLVRVITKYSNGEGGFVSTQDTVVALQALAEYSTKFQSSENSSLDVEVTSGDDTWNFSSDPTNRLLVQMETLDVLNTELNVSVTATGKGCALVSSILRYNVPYFGEIEAFSATVDTAIFDCTSSIKACASYVLHDGESNMALMEFDLTTGFVPIEQTLEELLAGNIIKRYEVDGGHVTLYFDSIGATEICVKFKATREVVVADAKDATFTLYDYYDPQLTISKNFVISIGSECSETLSLTNTTVSSPTASTSFTQLPTP